MRKHEHEVARKMAIKVIG